MICIYHSRDLDGWMSAAIVKLWHEKEKRDGELQLIGWDYGQPIPRLNAEKHSDLIIVDVSFSPEMMVDLCGPFNLTWIDHHISAIKAMEQLSSKPIIAGARNDKHATCEIAWWYFFSDTPMPELVRLLGRYDCFGHKGTDEERKVLIFQYAARASLTNVDECYKALISIKNKHIVGWLNVGEGIYSYLCTEAKQKYAKRFEINLDGYKFGCVNDWRFNPINFGIQYHNDGYDGFACFWYENGKWTFSLYNDNGKVDCSVIAKNRGGGGHKGASGFIIKSFDEFLVNI